MRLVKDGVKDGCVQHITTNSHTFVLLFWPLFCRTFLILLCFAEHDAYNIPNFVMF
jgi:hypothetical protein